MSQLHVVQKMASRQDSSSLSHLNQDLVINISTDVV
jgi:hypothetical protein